VRKNIPESAKADWGFLFAGVGTARITSEASNPAGVVSQTGSRGECRVIQPSKANAPAGSSLKVLHRSPFGRSARITRRMPSNPAI